MYVKNDFCHKNVGILSLIGTESLGGSSFLSAVYYLAHPLAQLVRSLGLGCHLHITDTPAVPVNKPGSQIPLKESFPAVWGQ